MSLPAAAETEASSRLARGSRWDLPLLLLAYTLTFVVRFLWDMDGTLHWEETLQPTGALLLLDDFSLGSLIRLQYVSWCGGCAAETLLYLPLAWLFDGALVSWKLVPLGFGLAILALVHRLALWSGGRVAGLAAGVALVLAPSFFMQNRMHAWANHFEGALFVLALLGLWLLWMKRDTPLLGFLIGSVAGLGFWFCYSTAFALPVLAVLALVARPKRLLTALATGIPGLLLGLTPWALTQWALRDAGVVSKDLPWTAVYGGSLSENLTPLSMLGTRLSDLTGPVFWRLSVHHDLGSAAPAVGFGIWLAFAGVVVVAIVLGARWLRSEGGGARSLGLAAGALVLAYLALNLAVTPFGVNRGTFMDVFSLRYLSLSFPLQALCLGLVVGWLWQRGRAACVGGVALVLLVCSGGLLDLGFTVGGPSYVTRAPRLTAVRVDHNVCGRLAGVTLPSGQDPAVFLEEVAARAPEAPMARRMALYRVGNGLGFSVTRGRASDWAQALGALSERDRSAFLEGAACTVWNGKGLTGRDWVPVRGPLPGLRPLLEALQPSDAALLSEKTFVPALSKSSRAASTLLGEDLDGLASLALQHPSYAAGLARQLGTLRAWRHEGSLDQLLPQGGGPLRADFVRGLGCMVGERWAHAPSASQGALGDMAAEERAVALAGLEACAVRTYTWPRLPEAP